MTETSSPSSREAAGDPPPRSLLLARRPDLVEAVNSAAGEAGVECQVFEDPELFLAAVRSQAPELCILSQALLADVADFCQRLRGQGGPLQVILVTPQTRLQDRDLLKLGVDNFLLDPPGVKNLRALFADFLDTRRRLQTLAKLSLVSRKRDIIEEIGQFGSHVQLVKRLKEEKREMEERLEEAQTAKERLAAEIRARDRELQALRLQQQKHDAESDRLREEIASLKGQLARSRDRTAAGLELLDQISGELKRALSGAGTPPPRLHALDQAGRERILELERRTREADRIFDRLLEILTEFASGREPDLEKSFERITDLLVEYTSI